MHEKFLKPFKPDECEDTIYKQWEESGLFNPDVSLKLGRIEKDAPSFSLVLPPPNVTGTLHMGHAAMLAIEDILVRHARMEGKKTLWIPGADSAAIATQAKVEDMLYKKEKKTRHDIGREELLQRIGAFAKESEGTILNQLRKMGSSLDWSRYAYTLDEKRYRAVRTAFVRMYEAGLIYRGSRIVNWDPKLQTTVSDDEIEHVEEKASFYYLQYGPFVISTARPETKFGDKYVVMHPDDARYSVYADGQRIELEWIQGPVTATVIKDTAIDPEFGTGVMTITPWHDATDFDIAKRHNLTYEQIIDFNGKLLPIAGEFAGVYIKKARPLIVSKLKEKGLLVKVDENYTHNIATNSRGGGTIEPQIKEQWFVNVNAKFKVQNSKLDGIPDGAEITLREMMRKVVETGQIKILPERFEKTYYHWIDNLRDWCISRQIWYGHRIPVWYRSTDADNKVNGTQSDSQKVETYVGVTSPSGEGWTQDSDTLDTWFSSGLWTFSTLGWPEETDDLKTYHPTTILETGYDIIFFWVARMILMSGYLLGEIPFKTVYLHGLVRDERGRKMSKSLGNTIDPLDMIAKYGADATRLSLIIGAAPGNDVKLSEDRVRGYKHFTNKVWNIARFVLSSIEDANLSEKPPLSETDEALIKELAAITRETSAHIKEYHLYLAAENLYHFVWHRFADGIIEESKSILKGDDATVKTARQWVLYQMLITSLKLLHPFMPFVTEEIWSHLPFKDTDMLLVAAWPTGEGEHIPKTEKE